MLDIGPEIVFDKTHFSHDPLPLYERRTRVAEMIEALSGKP